MFERLFNCKKDEVPSYLDTIEDKGDFFIVRLKGSIDMLALQDNRQKMTDVIEKMDLYSKDILVDFGKVTHTDSSTVAALLDRLIAIDKRNHKIGFFNIPEAFLQLIDVLKVSHNFVIYPAEDVAIQQH